ncbi:hypothetical protein JY97_13640 [Alkalispirochaeta odontotermitis]|uniref:PilZ domain-containing protein n=1 Tax=Olavius algarvensis spirochete endosymbiont TaxID=260710 RepID=UPI00052BE664|nr:flagellar brake protein [Olavius algarvensis spirochete endosymbiont]KGM42457.1 hypothetical protein JY97_13640 [Alkalispirochaeta odontotermitis]
MPKQTSATGIRGRLDFYLKGMDAGFSLSEIKVLWVGIKNSNFEKPSRIFGSIEALNALIGELIVNKKFLGRDGLESETQALKNLFAYRKDIELNRMKHYMGLKSTRSISIDQSLTIRVSGVGVYSTTVVENKDNYLTITIPVGNPLPMGFSWRRSKLNVYLWRKDDAGYFFQTRILEKFYDKSNLLFHLKHSDNLIRSQKRDFIRTPAKIYARLYLSTNLEAFDNLMESSLERDCLITDISEGGAALVSRGLIRKRQSLKLQFIVRNETAAVAGTVKSSHYNKTRNESTLRVEFLPISENLSMLLLSYILDINKERSNAMKQDGISTELSQRSKETADSSESEAEDPTNEETAEQDNERVEEF